MDDSPYAGISWRPAPIDDGRYKWSTEINGIVVRSTEQLTTDEATAYVKRASNLFRNVLRVNVEVDGEYVILSYDLKHGDFERIRRITGYLVGTLDRFNDAKRAEESERVKHGTQL